MPAEHELAVVFDELREKNAEHLKLLNSVIFPVKIHVSTLPPSRHLASSGVGADRQRPRPGSGARKTAREYQHMAVPAPFRACA